MSRLFVAIGFGLGAGFGILGGLLPEGHAQDAAWLVSSVGLVAGCLFLFARHITEGRDVAAVGFAFLAAGEIVMQAGQGTVEADRLAAFARGVALYVPGLLMLAWSDRYPLVARIASAMTAVPFSVHAVLHFLGREPLEQGPAGSLGYMLLTVAMVTWVWGLYRPAAPSTPVGRPAADGGAP